MCPNKSLRSRSPSPAAQTCYNPGMSKTAKRPGLALSLWTLMWLIPVLRSQTFGFKGPATTEPRG
jgi:hypothetical protein